MLSFEYRQYLLPICLEPEQGVVISGSSYHSEILLQYRFLSFYLFNCLSSIYSEYRRSVWKLVCQERNTYTDETWKPTLKVVCCLNIEYFSPLKVQIYNKIFYTRH